MRLRNGLGPISQASHRRTFASTQFAIQKALLKGNKRGRPGQREVAQFHRFKGGYLG
jgi:hypothetical protein